MNNLQFGENNNINNKLEIKTIEELEEIVVNLVKEQFNLPCKVNILGNSLNNILDFCLTINNKTLFYTDKISTYLIQCLPNFKELFTKMTIIDNNNYIAYDNLRTFFKK